MAVRVTIEDIAAAAGVSRQTVTRAMNNMPEISASTRARVLAVSEDLGYRPSRFASNLARSTKSMTLAFVVDSFRNPYYSELTADLLDAATARGWQVTVSSHENQPELELLSRLAGEADVVVGYLSEPDEEKLVAASRGVPVVLLGRTATDTRLHSVDIDFEHGVSAAFAQLRVRGASRFGMIESHTSGVEYTPSGRRTAFEHAVTSPSREAIVVCESGPQSIDAGESGMRELLFRYPYTDTVLAFSDLMAMGALRYLHEVGLTVPASIRVIGIDGLALGAITSPALSSLAIVGSDFAAEIVSVVEAALLEGAAPQRRNVIPAMLWRETA